MVAGLNCQLIAQASSRIADTNVVSLLVMIPLRGVEVPFGWDRSNLRVVTGSAGPSGYARCRESRYPANFRRCNIMARGFV
jgi:hypothetical protein